MIKARLPNGKVEAMYPLLESSGSFLATFQQQPVSSDKFAATNVDTAVSKSHPN